MQLSFLLPETIIKNPEYSLYNSVANDQRELLAQIKSPSSRLKAETNAGISSKTYLQNLRETGSFNTNDNQAPAKYNTVNEVHINKNKNSATATQSPKKSYVNL